MSEAAARFPKRPGTAAEIAADARPLTNAQKIALLDLALRIDGPSAARALWQRLGLARPPGFAPRHGAFFEECCERHPGARLAARELYAAYCVWAEARGLRPLAPNAFGFLAADHGLERARRGDSRGYLNLALKSDRQAGGAA